MTLRPFEKPQRLRLLEKDIKIQVRDTLKKLHIPTYRVVQGLGSEKGIGERFMLWKGQTIWLEIKKPGGKLSPDQEKFKADCEEQEIPYFIIRQIEELMPILWSMGFEVTL